MLIEEAVRDCVSKVSAQSFTETARPERVDVARERPGSGDEITLRCQITLLPRRIEMVILTQKYRSGPQSLSPRTTYLSVPLEVCSGAQGPMLTPGRIYLRGRDTGRDNDVACQSFIDDAARDAYYELLKQSLRFVARAWTWPIQVGGSGDSITPKSTKNATKSLARQSARASVLPRAAPIAVLIPAPVPEPVAVLRVPEAQRTAPIPLTAHATTVASANEGVGSTIVPLIERCNGSAQKAAAPPITAPGSPASSAKPPFAGVIQTAAPTAIIASAGKVHDDPSVGPKLTRRVNISEQSYRLIGKLREDLKRAVSGVRATGTSDDGSNFLSHDDVVDYAVRELVSARELSRQAVPASPDTIKLTVAAAKKANELYNWMLQDANAGRVRRVLGMQYDAVLRPEHAVSYVFLELSDRLRR